MCRLGLEAGFKDQEGFLSNQSRELLWEAVRGKCGQEAGGSVALCLGTLGSHGRFLNGRGDPGSSGPRWTGLAPD